MNNLNIGETFSLGGYDLIARAKTRSYDAEILVLNNNSTHFLVVRTDPEQHGPLVTTIDGHIDQGRGELVRSLQYNQYSMSADICYMRALAQLLQEVFE